MSSILNALRKVLSVYTKMPQLTQIILACALVAFAFNAGQCNGDSKLNKFRAEFEILQTEAKNTKQFADSAKAEVSRLTDEAKSKDSVITKLTLVVDIDAKKRQQLKGSLNVLEDSLKSAKDTAQIVQIQEGIIGNLKEQVSSAETTIGQQKEIISAQQFKITKLDSAVMLANRRGDSLQVVVDKIIAMPKPPRQWISPKTAGIIAFVAGVVVGDQIARR